MYRSLEQSGWKSETNRVEVNLADRNRLWFALCKYSQHVEYNLLIRIFATSIYSPSLFSHQNLAKLSHNGRYPIVYDDLVIHDCCVYLFTYSTM
jgi:hypothetical protein